MPMHTLVQRMNTSVGASLARGGSIAVFSVLYLRQGSWPSASTVTSRSTYSSLSFSGSRTLPYLQKAFSRW